MDDKIIVTNLSALTAKYKTSGVSKIKTACRQLIAADKKRGLATRIINIDDPKAMQKVGGAAVKNPKDPGQNKRAIDAVYKKLNPDYVMLLGSIDVIPHQDLKNPVPSDGDSHAFGDLPYACEKGYSRKPEDFIGPSRVVGRLPDLVGASDPAYLIGLLKTATNFKSRPPSDYDGYFALSSALWEGSTRMSLDNIFGSNGRLNLSPNRGPKWTPNALSKKFHFINCHGSRANPIFQGEKRKSEKGERYPFAHDAAHVAEKIVEGTVAAAECCYGAEQYDSILLAGGQMGISNAYLAAKAYGFFGSTTIAYGPPDDNGAADLICQYFLLRVMAGASIGRAALEARQEFVGSATTLDPFDLKTIAQFYLLGDPSVVPIKVPEPQLVAAPKTTAKSSTKSVDPRSVERNARRQRLRTKGLWLAKSQPVCASTGKEGVPKSLEDTMQKIAAKVDIKDPAMSSFAIDQKSASNDPTAKAMAATAFHVIVPGDASESNSMMTESGTVNAAVCVVAKEVGGNIVSYRELHRK